LPEKIVKNLIEGDDVFKDFMGRHGQDLSNQFEQVGGDRDAWRYGGEFYRHSDGTIIYFRGLEGEGIPEYSSWDIELKPGDPEYDAILERFPKALDDPETINDNERDRDEAIENLKQARADAKNEAVTMRVFRFTDDYDESDWEANVDGLIRLFGITREAWNEFTNAAKLLALARFLGPEEMDDYPEMYKKDELSKFLGVKL
jgi:hypothetical protein